MQGAFAAVVSLAERCIARTGHGVDSNVLQLACYFDMSGPFAVDLRAFSADGGPPQGCLEVGYGITRSSQ